MGWSSPTGWNGDGWSRAAAGLWTPASLGAALIAWYKADAGVYNDAGITLATNGQTIAQWNDQSGHGYHLSSSVGNTPTYATNTLNSLPVVDAAAGIVMLKTTSQPVVLGGTTLSVFSVRKAISLNAGANVRFLAISTPGSADTGADVAIIEYYPSVVTGPFTYNAGNKSNGTATANAWHELGTIFDGAFDTMYIDTSAQAAVAATPTFATNVDIQLNDPNLSYQVAEIVFTNTALDATARSNLHTYFLNKWGV